MTAGFQLVGGQDLSETQTRQAGGFESCFSAHHWSHLAKSIELPNSVGRSGCLNRGKSCSVTDRVVLSEFKLPRKQARLFFQLQGSGGRIEGFKKQGGVRATQTH